VFGEFIFALPSRRVEEWRALMQTLIVKTLSVLLAFLTTSVALADPPTPPPKPQRWELLGSYHTGEGAGRGLTNAVIDPDSIVRYRDIVSAFVGRDFIKLNGLWAPAAYSFIVSYKIDCKYHTYNELWFKTDRGFQNMEDQWVTIEPDSEPALAAKRVCANPAPSKPFAPPG
jgi:hypothetical protein